MLAHHPLTGKPIRVVKSSAQLWRNSKTLVYLSADADPAIPWGRWETAAAGLSVIQALLAKGIDVHIPILIDEPGLDLQTLTELSTRSHLLVISTAIIKTVGSEAFRAARLGNVLCLQEFQEIYSYCGAPWNGTAEDAAIMTCAVLHYSKIAGISENAERIRREALERMKITVLEKGARPPGLWLIQQFYKPEKAVRRREINRCLVENLACPYIDRIYLLNEDDFFDQYPEDPVGKIKQRVIGNRLTYANVLKAIKDDVPADTIVMFSNSDIFLEKTVRLLWSVNLEDKFLSLLRWDVDANGKSAIFGPRDDSQDAWVVWSNSVKSRTWKWPDFDFPFGKNGCDNAINVEMLRQKFVISNPAYSIKVQHVHMSDVRTYNPLDIVDKAIYLHIAPTGLNDLEAKESWTQGMVFRKVTHTPFAREIHSVQEKEIATYCSMIKRGEKYTYLKDSQNLTAAEPDTVLELKDCFLTANGLPYGHRELYIGPSERAKELWGTTGVGGCTPTLGTDFAVAAPLTEKETRSQEDFCIRYIAKILQIRDIDGEFLCPEKKSLLDVLQLFRWSKREVPVLPQDPNMGIYCKRALVWACSDSDQVSREDIAALRNALLVPWHEQEPIKKKMTIIEDGVVIDAQWIAALEEQLGEWTVKVLWPGRTSLERISSEMQDTDVFLYATGEKTASLWSWMWMLPQGARVIELQNEMEPTGDAIHMAGACDLRHELVIMRRGLREPMIKDSVKVVLKTLGSEMLSASVSKLPTIWLPRADIKGFYSHAGDSFREMARMWAERGYCQVKEHPTAVMCWWGGNGVGNGVGNGGEGVGTGCLLYDRPNLDWLYNAPAPETKWTRALFGNPEPTAKGRAWSFWARRPRFVEEIVASGAATATWSQRSHNLVFYGKIENRVQERRREGDWSSVCDDYYMARGAETPYPFTQKEYLMKLTEARFGLCLAGFGAKCHREIECMAMGCVPVVEGTVDMKHYASPPVEGVHYLRIRSRDTVKAQIAEITESVWSEMSAACREWWRVNASCEGFFKLTRDLAIA